jgi:hypothetical protein
VTSSTSANYVLVKDGLIPTNGMTLLGPVLSGSVSQCAGKCSTIAQCSSFTFQPSTSCQSCQPTSPFVTGTCQLMYFTIQDEVVLGPATSCQRLYVAEWCDALKPCMNSGRCNMARWPHFCQCSPGYGGTYCTRGKRFMKNKFQFKIKICLHGSRSSETAIIRSSIP